MSVLKSSAILTVSGGNTKNTEISYFSLYRGILPELKVHAELTRSVLWTRVLFPVETKKTIFIAFIAWYKREINCLNSHEIRMGKSLR